MDDDTALAERLLAAIARRGRPVAADDLLRAARVSRGERSRARTLLDELETAGRLVRNDRGRLTLPEELDLVAGQLEVKPSGFAFCVPDDAEAEDVYIPPSRVRPGLHGDRVLVQVGRGRRGRTEGRVMRVLQRGTKRVVGVLRQGRTTAVLVPQDARITVPIVVPRGAEGDGRDGDMVVAELVRYPGTASDAEAAVTTVLGPAADPRVETEAVIHAHGLPLEFPGDVRAAARRVPASVPDEALAGRLDLRDQPIVTIDGENARDFDDAVLVERDGRGWRLTVAVADVAHYVPAGGPIDLEARARGTSVYFPDRVIPMLPEELSNGICSLVPGQARLVKVVRLTLDPRGRVTGARFDDGVIRSAARLTYTEVRQALVDRDPAVRDRLGPLLAPLELAGELAPLLTEIRRARGALDFDLPEAEVVLDLRGRPESIVRAERSLAHRMIEEFMLAANEAVARELGRRRIAAIHRVHAPPGRERTAELARFLEGFGLRLKADPDHPTPGAFQAVLEKVAGRPEERLVNTVILRSLSQAAYSTEGPGHFGLATDWYTHFTSPIRRYPDLTIHRLLDLGSGGHGRAPRDLPAIAEESSRRERIAMEAEREIVQLKKVQLMQEKVGERFDGWVSGVAPFGAFVELRDVFVEGLAHVSALGDDFYELVEAEHLLRGRRTRRTFRVGDPVRVVVTGVSIERRQVEFALADTEGRTEPWRRRRRRS